MSTPMRFFTRAPDRVTGEDDGRTRLQPLGDRSEGSPAEALLTLSGVGKRYGRAQWVLRDVDLVLSRGEVVSVSAGNGAGKSTLLRLIVGAARPSAGSMGPRPQATRYVPDRVAANDRMPALAYLIHMGRIQGLPTAAARRRGAELLDRLELAGDPRTALRNLSKGNAQKVLLAQAMLTRPDLLVLDEPWSGLDVVAHGVLSELIAEVAQAGGAVLFTDHREQVVLAHATVRYVLEDGRLRVAAPIDAATGSALASQAGVQVVLSKVRGVAEPDPDWLGLPGVVSATSESGRLLVQVAQGSVDELLGRALADSWSVYTVTRRAGADGSGAQQ